MDTDKIIELAFYCLPAAITGAVAYYSFERFSKNDENRRRFMLLKENQKQSLPLKLQAYERLALFLERINPTKLVLRVGPLNSDKLEYQNLLVHHIDKEYEHNLAQQIYISDECWLMITNAKNTIIQNIRKISIDTTILDADKLREKIISDQFENDTASTIALNYLKNEVKEII